MSERKKEFDELCKSNSTDFQFALNGFVRMYEDRNKDDLTIRLKRYPGWRSEMCEKCSNLKTACVCMDTDGLD